MVGIESLTIILTIRGSHFFHERLTRDEYLRFLQKELLNLIQSLITRRIFWFHHGIHPHFYKSLHIYTGVGLEEAIFILLDYLYVRSSVSIISKNIKRESGLPSEKSLEVSKKMVKNVSNIETFEHFV